MIRFFTNYILLCECIFQNFTYSKEYDKYLYKIVLVCNKNFFWDLRWKPENVYNIIKIRNPSDDYKKNLFNLSLPSWPAKNSHVNA